MAIDVTPCSPSEQITNRVQISKVLDDSTFRNQRETRLNKKAYDALVEEAVNLLAKYGAKYTPTEIFTAEPFDVLGSGKAKTIKTFDDRYALEALTIQILEFWLDPSDYISRPDNLMSETSDTGSWKDGFARAATEVVLGEGVYVKRDLYDHSMVTAYRTAVSVAAFNIRAVQWSGDDESGNSALISGYDVDVLTDSNELLIVRMECNAEDLMAGILARSL